MITKAIKLSAFLFLFQIMTFGQSGTWEIVEEFDSPGTGARGLCFALGYIWHVDLDLQTLFKLNPNDLSVIESFDLPGNSPFGVTYDGQYFWTTSANENKLFKLDPTSFEVIDEYNMERDIWGITFDGTNFKAVADMGTTVKDHLVTIDPNNGQIIDEQVWPFNRLTDVEYIFASSELFITEYKSTTVSDTGFVYNTNPNNFSINEYFVSPGPVPEGITYDGQYFYISHFRFGIYKIWKIKLIRDEVYGHFNPTFSDIILCDNYAPNRTLSYDLSGFNNIEEAKLIFGYFNFDYIVDEYPANITLEYVDFEISIDGENLFSEGNITSSTTVKREIDILNYVLNNDTLHFQFKNTGGNDGIAFVKPIISIIDTTQGSGMNDQFNDNQFVLYPSYPNPFINTIKVPYSIITKSKVRFEIYNELGLKVHTKNIGNQIAGDYSFNWDGKNFSGMKVKNGNYFIRLIINNNAQTSKVVYIK